jgi:hypothetical protein
MIPTRTGAQRLAAAAALTFVAFGAAPRGAGAEDPVAPEGIDRVRLKSQILRRLDADIDARCAKAHLDARLMLDELLPIAYLGLDADPVAGGMKITKVYPGTGAEAAGLAVGDVVRSVGGAATDGKTAFGRAIRRFSPGDTTTVVVDRGGKPLELTATLGPRPEEDEDEDEQFPELAGADEAPKPFATDFESDAAGALPAAMESFLGGHGRAPRWLLVKDAAGGRLRQDEPDRTGIRFPLAIATGFVAHDAAASVRFRYVKGEQDRAAGIVLRFHDPANYLVARCNAIETDLRIFRVANGIRRTLPGGVVKAVIDDREWHTLTFRAEGALLTATVDGKATATSYDTYLGRGRAGLWTKSDAVSEFDDFRVEAIAKKPAEAPPK